ncbi:MAG TPA: adenosylhomocysteinase, partial [Candidatus Woesebacteria bacterium]|nr:adenosylhomocysteinase [Candidatus Woesebacteria bacterium]
AGQALAAEYIWKHKGKLENKVSSLPSSIDAEIAQIKLESKGIKIDKLTPVQKKYLNSWEEGT